MIVLDKLFGATSLTFGGPDYRTLLVTSVGIDESTGIMRGGDNGGVALI